MEIIESLKKLEQDRTRYWESVDYFLEERLKWRAQMVRHLFHLFPGESILELGSGTGEWTKEISEANKNSNPICSATFNKENFGKLQESTSDYKNIEPVFIDSFPESFSGRKFDFIVGWHLFSGENYGPFLNELKGLLKPGGQILLFEINPWNPFYILRRFLTKIFFLKGRSESGSINRIDLFTVLSEIGFVGIKILPYDFVFPPIPKSFLKAIRNLTLIFENMPYFRNFAGSLYLWAKKPALANEERKKINLVVHSQLKNKISLVVPCHNEETNVTPLIENLKACYGEYFYEFVIVDDNSRDKTAQIVEDLSKEDPRIRVIKRSMPNGVGRALRDGLAAAEGEYVLLMDCDFQHILPELTGLFDAVAEGADVAIGSRFSRDSVLLNYAFTKILANRGFHILANILLGKGFRDVTNNLKLMKREVAKRLNLEYNDFAANAETGLQPILLGFNVKEVPISWINRSVDMGFSSFNLSKTGPNYIRALFNFFWRRIRGKELILPSNNQ